MGRKARRQGSKRALRSGAGYKAQAPRCYRTKKMSFLSWAKAEKAGRQVNGYERSYRCNLCGWWHITSYTMQDMQHRQVELHQMVKEQAMAWSAGDPAPDGGPMSPEDFSAKVEWEGGIFDALDYGLKFTNVDPGTELGVELRDAWRYLQIAYEAMGGPLTTVTRILNKIEGLDE